MRINIKIIISAIVIFFVVALLIILSIPNPILTKIIIYKLSKINASINFYDKNNNLIFQTKGKNTPINIHINVNKNKLFFKLYKDKDKGRSLMESYIDNWWYTDNLPKLLTILLINNKEYNLKSLKEYIKKNNS